MVDSTYKSSGELIGTWTFPRVGIVYYRSDTRIYARGTESFEGCVNLNGDNKCDKSEPSGRWQGECMLGVLRPRRAPPGSRLQHLMLTRLSGLNPLGWKGLRPPTPTSVGRT